MLRMLLLWVPHVDVLPMQRGNDKTDGKCRRTKAHLAETLTTHFDVWPWLLLRYKSRLPSRIFCLLLQAS